MEIPKPVYSHLGGFLFYIILLTLSQKYCTVDCRRFTVTFRLAPENSKKEEVAVFKSLRTAYKKVLLRTFRKILPLIIAIIIIILNPNLLGFIIALVMLLVIIPVLMIVSDFVSALSLLDRAFREDAVQERQHQHDDKIRVVTSPNVETALYSCNHTGPAEYKLIVFGHKGTTTISEEACPQCAIRHIVVSTIQCPNCLKPIFVGEAVRTKQTIAGKIPIGCMRQQCFPRDEPFEVGIWTGIDVAEIGEDIGVKPPFIPTHSIIVVTPEKA